MHETKNGTLYYGSLHKSRWCRLTKMKKLEMKDEH